jgi:uncharacterized membrane protein YphA (DoxX/SURF4 family)
VEQQRRQRTLRIVREIFLWALTALLVMVFVRAGLDKFDDSSGWARAFRFWGYPVWFRLTIGALELLGALLILWPRTAAYGGAIIAVIMLGGMGTHIFVERRPAGVTSEIVQLVFSSILVAGRWRQRINPFAR